MKVLITGVAGLLGSRLADYVIENNLAEQVVGIDDLSGGYVENIHDDVVFYKRNLFKDSIDEIFIRHNIDYVFHFAAYAAEGLSPFVRKFNYLSNVVATAAIVNCCIKYGIKRLVFTSSMAVYGDGQPPFSERKKPNPVDPYGIAKYACEMDMETAFEQHGLEYCIIRPHNVYGNKQNIWDKYRNVLGIWMYQKLNKLPFTIYGDGLQTRSFSFIDDSLPCLWSAALLEKAKNEVINLGGIEDTTILEAANILSEVVGGAELIFLEERHEVKRAFPTYQKSIDLLGFEHKVSLYDGLSIMWEWAKKQPHRDRKSWSKYEIEKNIYSFWKN